MKSVPLTRSRRERPAKPALSREGIIGAAADILRQEGLGRVTMRRVAAALDTGPASLYVYVRDTEDLHAEILDRLLAGLGDGLPPEDWRERLKVVLERYTGALFAFPDMARMAMSTMPSGPHYLRLVDTILGLLQQGGVDDREAAWGVDLLLLHATAHAAEHGTWQESGGSAAQLSALETAMQRVDPNLYPHIARHGDELLSGGPSRLSWGFDVLINGILRTARRD